MKTIKELNNKIWYRFLKVIYVLFYILIIIGWISLILLNPDMSIKDIDQNKTTISCIGSDKKFSPKNLGVQIDQSMFKNDSNNYTNLSYINDPLNEVCKKLNLPTIKSADGKFTVLSPLYEIKPQYTYFNDTTLIFAISLLSIFIIFEVIRRIFYYIILGTISPKSY